MSEWTMGGTEIGRQCGRDRLKQYADGANGSAYRMENVQSDYIALTPAAFARPSISTRASQGKCRSSLY